MTARADRWLGGALVLLALALAANSLLGPLVAGVVTYPFSRTLFLQTVGLEAVSLVLVAPWAFIAGMLHLRGDDRAPLLAVPPSAYTAYMFVQYVVGPQYTTYAPSVGFHLGIFVLSEVTLVAAWMRVRRTRLPPITARRRRVLGGALVGLAAFVALRYLPAFAGMATGAPLPAEFATDPSMYWSIVLLDVGVVVPATLATALGLFRGRSWARPATFAVLGWFTLVPVSVAAMALTMIAAGDPNADVATAAMLSIVAVAFSAFAAWVWWPILDRR